MKEFHISHNMYRQKSWNLIALNYIDLVIFFVSRDNEEWLKYRQPLNNHLLRDTHWCEKLIQQTCENFVDKIKRTSLNDGKGLVHNLEDEIYLWSTYCNLYILSSEMYEKNLIFSFIVASNHEFNGWIYRLC
jgi:hypothetical protein